MIVRKAENKRETIINLNLYIKIDLFKFILLTIEFSKKQCNASQRVLIKKITYIKKT